MLGVRSDRRKVQHRSSKGFDEPCLALPRNGQRYISVFRRTNADNSTELMNHRLLLPLLVLVACSFLNGCAMESFSSLDSEPQDETAQPGASQSSSEEADAARAPGAKSGGSSLVEVFWQVPTEAVEKYHLYYGLDPDALDNHVEVAVNELEKIDHPKLGPVFRYEIKAIPANKPIFLSLQAENKSGRLSDRTHPAKVEAEGSRAPR